MIYFDLLYILPALILTMWASIRVKTTYNKYAKVNAHTGVTATAVARRILDGAGLTNVSIERIAGDLTDHYDPRTNVIRLSDSVADSTSIAAIGVAAHECGHAIQHAQAYAPIRIRQAIIPITNVSSRLAVPLVLLGILLTAYAENFISVAYAGVILFGVAVLFQLVTLPVEFNASSRALTILSESGTLDAGEIKGARRVLSAAAMTYVAALTASVLQMLRLLSIVNNRRR